MNRIFVVDLGFSGLKWLVDDQKGIIKSVYRKTKQMDEFLFNGERFVIGEKALLQTGSHYLRTINELVEFYPLFTAYAAEKIGISEECILVVGLPYDHWQSESIKGKKGLHNDIEALKQSLKEITANSACYRFKDVLVFPQGLGCIKAYIANHPETTGNVMGIDMGFNTVIYALYSTGEKSLLYGRTLYKRGVHDMAVNYLMHEIEKHAPGKSFTPAEINHIIATGKLQAGFQNIDLTPEIKEASDQYARDILKTIIGDIKENMGVITFDTILFAGGGARLIKNNLSSSKVTALVLPEPEYANVMGFKLKAEEVIAKDESR